MWRPSGIFDETYTLDMAIVRTRRHWGILIISLVVLFLFPLMDSYFLVSLINSLSITIIVLLGLQIVSGYCGQISFGQAAFMGVGGYASAILTMKVGLSFWLAMPLAGIITGILGLLGGAPSLRIKGFYLAMATIAIHYVVMWLLLHLEITGQTAGLKTDPPKIGAFSFNTDERMYYIIVPIMLLMTYGARNIMRSRVGRAIIAIRDNDLAAQVLGIDLFYYKMVAFFISCFYAGVAGSLLAHSTMLVHPEQFTLMNAIWFLGMLIVGGMGSIPGVFFGVIFIRILDELVMIISPYIAKLFPWMGLAPAAALGATAFGIVLSLFLILEPRGLAHKWEIIKASSRLYPFAH